MFSIKDVEFDEYFCFTDTEVQYMLHYKSQERIYDTVQEWYDSYRFRKVTFNRWNGNSEKSTKIEMEQLINDENIQKVIHQELTYLELYSSIDNIRNALFMTGYLTQRVN